MQPLEQPNERAMDLYWLAFLLTGHRGLSVDVTLETVAAYAAAGANFISVGALTHSAPVLDIGLDIESEEA